MDAGTDYVQPPTDPLNPMGSTAPLTTGEAQKRLGALASPPDPWTQPGASLKPAERAFGKEQQARADLNAAIPEQMPEGQPGQPSISMIKPIMAVTAPLMLLIAAGGAFTKANGYAMMGALNGMVQGANKGDAEGRNRAWQQYQDTYAAWKDKVEESHRVHAEMLAALKGNVDAAERATEFALKVRGDTLDHYKDRADQIDKERKWLTQYIEANAKLREAKDREDAMTRYRFASLYGKATQGKPRFDLGMPLTERLMEITPQLIAKYKAKTGEGDNTVLPKKFGDILSALSDDPLVQEFQGDVKDLKAVLITIEAAPGMRGNMFMQQVFSNTTPDLWSMSAGQLAQQVTNANQMVTNQGRQQQAQLKEFQNRYSAAGGGDLGYDVQQFQSVNTPGSMMAGGSAAPPPEAMSALKEGQITHFANGQKWTLKDGKPVQVD